MCVIFNFSDVRVSAVLISSARLVLTIEPNPGVSFDTISKYCIFTNVFCNFISKFTIFNLHSSNRILISD